MHLTYTAFYTANKRYHVTHTVIVFARVTAIQLFDVYLRTERR